MRYIPTFFVPAAFLLLGGQFVQTSCTAAHTLSPESKPHYEIGQEVRIEGVVLENVLDCERDLSCYLRLETATGEIIVVYATSRGTPCPNYKVAQQTLKIQQNTRVRIFARAIGSAEISTCPDQKYEVALITEGE